MAYNFRLTEKKWQEFWANNNAYKVDNMPLKKAYILEMLPYPSGHLHMGHVRNYSIGDAIARFKIAQGFDVLHPMGWDAFGLPAENAALERNVHPKNWTLDNIKNMKEQLSKLGLSYDWDREITSCLPNYYGHEQKIFLDFYKNGLAYKKESWVNWDPVEQSVLANEQVVDGKGWRSGAVVERKKLNQWFLKITDYADELLDSLKDLTGWPEKVTKMQENWIGKSTGALVNFGIEGLHNETIEIFTTRPETLFGASFIGISAHHPLLKNIKITEDIHNFIKECDQSSTAEAVISTKEKKGIDTGLKAVHPLNENIKLPVYIANFVLSDYGTGALFGCPAHDERDFEFAQKYNLPIRPVIETTEKLPYLGTGELINSEFLNGLSIEQAVEKVCIKLTDLKKGSAKTTYRLRDWLISRQRYWGCPIPLIYCNDCGMVDVPEKDLPVTLPDDVTFDKPGNPLDHHPTWKHTTCPKCNKNALRETDTLDTFFESSWYFLRYCAPQSHTPLEKESVNTWAPVDWYIGGIEHAVLHLLYARFFTKALRDLKYLDFGEPFINLLTQGMVCHETYKSIDDKWLYPEEVEKEKGQVIHRETKQPVQVGSPIKMSKSKRNTVDPLYIVETYGADVARLFVLSDTPPDKDFSWNEEGLEGCWRYANKLWRLIETYRNLKFDQSDESRSKNCLSDVHQNLEKITTAYGQNGFNKAIAFHREMVRSVEEHLPFLSKDHAIECLNITFKTIQPIMPHLAHEVLDILSVKCFTWPMFNPNYCVKSTVTMAIQVNGKLRGTIDISVEDSKESIEQQAKTAVDPYIKDKNIKKTVIVPSKIVNFVVD